MRTVRCSGRLSCHTYPPTPPCMPLFQAPSWHACPTLPCPLPHMPPSTATHGPLPCTPLSHTHALPCMLHPPLPCTLPTTHTPLPCTPPAIPPLPCTSLLPHTPLCHACPPATHTPTTHTPLLCTPSPLWTEWQMLVKTLPFRKLLSRTVITISIKYILF